MKNTPLDNAGIFKGTCLDERGIDEQGGLPAGIPELRKSLAFVELKIFIED